MSAVDLAAVVVAVVCLMTVVALTVAVQSLLRCLRELRGVVDELRGSALPLVDDLRSTVVQADAELDRVQGVIGRAERVAVTVDHASRLTYRAFAPPLIKGLSLVSGAGHAVRCLRDRRRARRSLDVTTTPTDSTGITAANGQVAGTYAASAVADASATSVQARGILAADTVADTPAASVHADGSTSAGTPATNAQAVNGAVVGTPGVGAHVMGTSSAGGRTADTLTMRQAWRRWYR